MKVPTLGTLVGLDTPAALAVVLVTGDGTAAALVVAAAGVAAAVNVLVLVLGGVLIPGGAPPEVPVMFAPGMGTWAAASL